MEKKISPAALKLKQALTKAYQRSEEEKIKDFKELKNDPNSIFSKNEGKPLGTSIWFYKTKNEK